MGAKTPEEKKRVKYAAMMRERGTPLHITPAEHAELVAHIMKLYRRGMSCQAILDSIPGGTTIHDSAISKITRGQVCTCHRDTYNALMRSEWVQPTELKTGRRLPSLGLRRRLQALVADGWPMSFLAEIGGVSVQAVLQQCEREADAHASTIAKWVPIYEKLCATDPLDNGVTELGVKRAKGNAARRGWAGSWCWDDDTIDDPDAFPEWTGACGTVTGYNLHRSERVHVKQYRDRNGKDRLTVLCEPCCAARVHSKAEQQQRITETRESVIQWLAEGKSDQWIAAEAGLSTRTILRIKKEQAA